jgi:hypothetical protein
VSLLATDNKKEGIIRTDTLQGKRDFGKSLIAYVDLFRAWVAP